MLASAPWGVLQQDGAVYAYDDAYIHLATARTWVETGVWGLHQDFPSSPSSSVGWTFLLACCMQVFGDWDGWPLVLNLIAGVVFVWTVAEASVGKRWFGLWVLLATALRFGVAVGMEHVLHGALLVVCYSRLRRPAGPVGFFLFGAALVSLRYESVAFVGAAAVWLWSVGEWRRGAAGLIGAGGALGISSLISWVSAGMLLPNSIVVKSLLRGGVHPLAIFERMTGPSAFFLWMLLAAIVVMTSWREGRRSWLPVVSVCAIASHILLSRLSPRQDVALWALGGFTLLTVVSMQRSLVPRVVVGLAMLMGLIRGGELEWYRSDFQRDIRDQHLYLARVFARRIPGRTVFAHDVGALGYRGRVRVVDLWGLAYCPARDAWRDGYSHEAVRRFAEVERPVVAVGLDTPEWFGSFLPEEWPRCVTISYDQATVSEDTLSLWSPSGQCAEIQSWIRADPPDHATVRYRE